MQHPHRLTRRPVALSIATALALACGCASAQSTLSDAELREQIAALRVEQARIAEQQARTDAALRALEARLGVSPETDAATVAAAPSGSAPAGTSATAATPAVAAAPAAASRFKVTGDLRLRGQHDRSDRDAPDRTSSQLRARVGATFAVNDRITVGARMVTGDADDPNSTDVQLSNWDDDLQVSLDLAYMQFNLGDLTLYGGKIPQPFTRTDLVWDGDVNPQGASAVYKRALGNGGAFRANGLFFVVDEQAAGPDSTMAGVQFGYDSPAHGALKYDVSAGFYDYSLGSVAGADAGDFRTNLRNPDGSYLSDFRLVDLVGGVTWQGENPKLPVRVLANYVKNLGAATDDDTGYGVDVSLGRASQPGDWRVTYGYSQTDVDAVLSAFSHDNIGIATNYKLHALTLDWVPMAKTQVSGIWYHYKPKDALYAGSNAPSDFLDRFRLFLLVNF